MGLCSSKSATQMSALSRLDDSVKVMIKHDAKVLAKKGQQPHGYVPRRHHDMEEFTMRRPAPVEAEESTGSGDTSNDAGVDTEPDVKESPIPAISNNANANADTEPDVKKESAIPTIAAEGRVEEPQVTESDEQQTA